MNRQCILKPLDLVGKCMRDQSVTSHRVGNIIGPVTVMKKTARFSLMTYQVVTTMRSDVFIIVGCPCQTICEGFSAPL